MADPLDQKISQLPATTIPTTADILPIVQSSVTDEITVGNLLGASTSAAQQGSFRSYCSAKWAVF